MIALAAAPAAPQLAADLGPHWVSQFYAVMSALLLGALLMVAAWLLMPLAKAWARRIEHGQTSRGNDASDEELQYLRERVAELEASTSRLAELEERLDFAERVIAQHRDAPAQLNGPGAL